ncbi:uncharacterized protein LOC128737458 [Sabethes cyaneus]|uniref:uncharacterized protein LOC128737458 n=1 Tax=Sabethes cyaneus TaxID=53552 RepID=UPI00237DB5F1|nr:uncharacterized protein LOC128737458 [Sabethes cyaneus]
MNMSTEQSVSEIPSCRSLLSGRDLLAHYMTDFQPHTSLNRLVLPEEESAHQNEIIQLKEEFRQILSQQHVDREDLYSKGEWENDRKRVRILKAQGKWNVFGYQENKNLYLNGYEALHLMEMNRLIVYWSSVIVSMEQAYMLFLGYPDSLDLEEYLVYNILMRSGFYLLKYDANREYESDMESGRELDEDQKCIWRNLYEMLHQPNPLIDETDSTIDPIKYDEIKRSMLSLRNSIMFQTTPVHSEQSEAKRKRADSIETSSLHFEQSKTKRKRASSIEVCSEHNEGVINKSNNIFNSKLKKFNELFHSFNVIKSTLNDSLADVDREDNQLKFSFDMYTADGSVFRKSRPTPPEHRILVRRSNQSLPTAAEIGHFFQCQPTPSVPILLMLVSDTLSINCFLYNFNQLPSNIIAVRYPKSSIAMQENSALNVESDDDEHS